MPSSSSPRRVSARRALIADISADRTGWLKHGMAALAISVLGLGVAASVSLTGAAQGTTDRAASPVRTEQNVQSDATPNPRLGAQDGSAGTSDATRVKSLADQRAEELAEASKDYGVAARSTSAKARDKSLQEQAEDAEDAAKELADREPVAAGDPADADEPAPTVQGNGKACLPLASYRISARFGQVGIWSRYHTGFDFSAPIGSAIRAPSAGVVTNAGIGPASGWAGNYVAIRYPDGTQTLSAHMSTVSVSVGQTVSPCQVVGAVGMTGRTFGPHLHFEAYPAGITPGDIYSAVSPANWLNARGLNP